MARNFYLLYVKLEEEHGLGKHVVSGVKIRGHPHMMSR
jgi:hypothetical protein